MDRRSVLATGISMVVGLPGCLSRIRRGGDDNGDDGQSNITEQDGGNVSATTEANESTGNETDSDNQQAEISVGSETEPTEIVEAFYKAIYTPDVETANSLFHSESESARYTEETLARFEEYDYELRNVRQVDSGTTSDGVPTATVELELVIDDPERGERSTGVTVDLRMDEVTGDDGETTEQWRIYESQT